MKLRISLGFGRLEFASYLFLSLPYYYVQGDEMVPELQKRSRHRVFLCWYGETKHGQNMSPRAYDVICHVKGL